MKQVGIIAFLHESNSFNPRRATARTVRGWEYRAGTACEFEAEEREKLTPLHMVSHWARQCCSAPSRRMSITESLGVHRRGEPRTERKGPGGSVAGRAFVER